MIGIQQLSSYIYTLKEERERHDNTIVEKRKQIDSLTGKLSDIENARLEKKKPTASLDTKKKNFETMLEGQKPLIEKAKDILKQKAESRIQTIDNKIQSLEYDILLLKQQKEQTILKMNADLSSEDQRADYYTRQIELFSQKIEEANPKSREQIALERSISEFQSEKERAHTKKNTIVELETLITEYKEKRTLYEQSQQKIKAILLKYKDGDEEGDALYEMESKKSATLKESCLVMCGKIKKMEEELCLYIV